MIPYSRPKLSDLYTLSQSKLLENHTLHSGTYLYSPYMAVPPPPPGIWTPYCFKLTSSRGSVNVSLILFDLLSEHNTFRLFIPVRLKKGWVFFLLFLPISFSCCTLIKVIRFSTYNTIPFLAAHLLEKRVTKTSRVRWQTSRARI